MSGIEFYNTRMGQQFFCSDVPRIANALEKIAKKDTMAHSLDGKVKFDFAGGKNLSVERQECLGKVWISFILEDEGYALQNLGYLSCDIDNPTSVDIQISKDCNAFDSEIFRVPLKGVE